VPDRAGRGVGTDFIGTTLDDGYLYVLAYSDDTSMDVYDSETDVWQAGYTLDAGEIVDVNPGNGLWRVISDHAVSVHSVYPDYRGEGHYYAAEFAPLAFNQFNLDFSKVDDVNDLDCRSPGQAIEYEICFTNDTDQTFDNAYIVTGCRRVWLIRTGRTITLLTGIPCGLLKPIRGMIPIRTATSGCSIRLPRMIRCACH